MPDLACNRTLCLDVAVVENWTPTEGLDMRATRKMAMVGLSVAVPLGLLVGATALGGTAWAAASPHKAGTGTVNCSGTSSTITFSPPLLPNGASKETAKATSTGLGSCVGATATGLKVTLKTSGSATNSCKAFATAAHSDSLLLTVKWSGLSPTKIKFGPGSIALNSTDSGFNATGGKATGSFPTSSATFDLTLSQTSINSLEGCINGSGSVSSLQITGGTSTV